MYYLMEGHFGEQGLRLVIADTGMDDDIVALLPVDRRGDPVVIPKLKSYILVNIYRGKGVEGVSQSRTLQTILMN